jgi:hypothetical protein
MKSVMVHSFSDIAKTSAPRSTFDRSHGHKSAIDAGYLYPVFVDEILPGDSIKLSPKILARLSTPLYPLMDNITLDFDLFFVNNRILWENWVKFMGEQRNPSDSTDYTVPTMTSPAGGYDDNSIYDYMGLPPGIAGYEHSVLPLRAYNVIYDEFYRDENLSTSLWERTGDTGDLETDFAIRSRGKRHDYFSSCLPWPQKNNADEVVLPLGTSAPVLGIGTNTQSFTTGPLTVYESDGGSDSYGYYGHAGIEIKGTAATNGYPDVYADLSNATAATINELRQAVMIQKMLERDARSGTRYGELVRAHFGVTNPDGRLQRPEFLGRVSGNLNINPVAQTGTDTTTPVGTLGGFGTIAINQGTIVGSFSEHGWLIGILSTRHDLTYQQGIERFWTRQTRYDHYFPDLAHLGEMAVKNQEIYVQGTSADDDVFGYQEAWADYRYKPSKLSAEMRSSHATSLDAWHLSQEFSSLPTLNSTFIKDAPPMSRVIASGTDPHFILDAYLDYKHTRAMPVFSIPGFGARL